MESWACDHFSSWEVVHSSDKNAELTKLLVKFIGDPGLNWIHSAEALTMTCRVQGRALVVTQEPFLLAVSVLCAGGTHHYCG